MSSDTQGPAESNGLHQWIDDAWQMLGQSMDQGLRFFDTLCGRGDTDSEMAGTATAMAQSVGEAFTQAWVELATHPQTLLQEQIHAQQQLISLWQQSALRMMGQEFAPVIEPEPGDRRFADPEWTSNPLFDYMKQAYLIHSRSLYDTVAGLTGLPPSVARQVQFFTRQYVNALSPSNFLLTNPEALRKGVESQGASVRQGMEQLLDDLKNSFGGLNVSMADRSAFSVGRNVATTPGEVVFQNRLMQLIQYAPSTPEVHRRPLLVIPPFINKYYIMDLRESNSLLKWLVDQGFTVFCVSWINPGEEYRDTSFDDYLLEGAQTAVDVVERITGESEINAIGYCMGGTLLSALLAYQKQIGDSRITSSTFLTTLIDFRDPGELGVFINDASLVAMEKMVERRGYFDGRALGFCFSLLRENDLFWSFVVNNYLKGERPQAFDLLYWNSDSTNLPAKAYLWYLRELYINNRLCKPNGLTLGGVPIDMTQVDQPSYFISTAQDHIARWQGTYYGARLFKGDVRFVLGGSGHIAGIINPPAKAKYGYWTRSDNALPEDPEQWYSGAEHQAGSWWNDWLTWSQSYAGERVPARQPGTVAFPAIEAAPGSYVRRPAWTWTASQRDAA